MENVVSLDRKRKDKLGIVPTEVIIVNKGWERKIKKDITIPFIPPKGTEIVFEAKIKGERKTQSTRVESCSYSTVTGNMWVWLIADDSVIDNLLESGGFSVVRH